MNNSLKILCLLALSTLACDPCPPIPPGVDTGDGVSTDTTSESDDGSLSTETGDPLPSNTACCMCLNGDLECLPSENAGECGIISVELGTPGLQLECTPTPEDPEGCPDIDCTPPPVACCACAAGESICTFVPTVGCTSAVDEALTDCTIDILGEIDCGQVC